MARSDQARAMAAMFDRVAPRYDRLNRLLSLGRDVAWRRRAVAAARLGDGETALDIGVGTGDVALALLRASAPSARVIGIDVSERMLALARSRARSVREGERFEARLADAQALPFADAAFDRVVAAFAVRNLGDLATALREMRRVLRPHGRAVILEFSQPPHPLVRAAHALYLRVVVPLVSALLGGDRAAYRHLRRSVAAFGGAELLAHHLRAAGFGRVRFERLTFGVVAIHVAEP